VALVIGALVVAAVVVVLTRPESTTADYSDRDRSDFLAACTADGGEPVQGTCECIYDRLVEHVPYERYLEVDAQLAAQGSANGQPLELPDDVHAVVAGCVPASG